MTNIEEVLMKKQADQIVVEDIMNILPEKRTQIIDIQTVESENIHVRFHTECSNEEEIKCWIKRFEEITKTTYSIYSTRPSTGRYVHFKQILNCQHNTGSKKVYNLSLKNRTKNTNCPSTMTITLHAIKKRYRGKDLQTYKLRKDLPCEISMILTHNHRIEIADILRFRRVSSETRQTLLSLFHNGHSPASALETIKANIKLYNSNNPDLLSDRSQCPDYNYCYYLYMKEFRKQLDFNTTGKELLKYNIEMDYNTGEIELTERDIQRENNVIEKLANQMRSFLETNSVEVTEALEKMSEHIEKLHTTAAFLSSCSNFTKDHYQPTAISRPKANIAGRRNQLRGRPKKPLNKIRRLHKLSPKIDNLDLKI